MATQPVLLDIETLEVEKTPIFVIKVGKQALDFKILFANDAFRKADLGTLLLSNTRSALLFRSWVQSLGETRSQNVFAGVRWISELAGKTNAFKVVTAMGVPASSCMSEDRIESRGSETTMKIPDSFVDATGDIRLQLGQNFGDDKLKSNMTLFKTLPRTHLDARWEGIQSMMEMSDVGVFEYNARGDLLHANDAWYRLSSHPRNLPAHVAFSFMDLVYPDDQALVMSMWNKLTQGMPVTFEMRWKPRVPTNAPQWVLSACVPIFDDDGNLISIAGNTIDINAQKRSQEATQARVEALELAKSSEMKFARFAQLSPTAIFIFVPGTGMKFVNDRFYELTGHSLALSDQTEWFNLIAPDDVERVKEDWAHMSEGGKPDGVQFRLKKTWVNQDGLRSNIWVQSSYYPEMDEQGKVMSIMGTLFDISHFKWAESVQQRRFEEALEAKRQQENFIDMTSHELRNPLSAVVQCADSVVTSLQRLLRHPTDAALGHDDAISLREDIETSIEALKTIISCSLHQKRIIDDVLTLSKLDSDLILITPIIVQPVDVVGQALKLFDMECSQLDIELRFCKDKTMDRVNWVMLDPSRLLQVLINLLTNAIKFTKERPERLITVTIGSSFERPPQLGERVTFVAVDQNKGEILDKPEWGKGKKAYLWITVMDTGCGMSEEEQDKLFQKFSQATPRTHIKYGGSGLGLYISRSLATRQGGAISVFSEANIGSTFAFFVGTRLVGPPNSHVPDALPSLRSPLSTIEAMKAVKLSVLIVEDNLVNQKVLEKQLKNLGWKVAVAGNGKEALEWLRQCAKQNDRETDEVQIPPTSINGDTDLSGQPKIDFVLMDIEMPVMDGLTCTRSIREYEQNGMLPALGPETPREVALQDSSKPHSSDAKTDRYKGIPILAMSANARVEQVNKAIAAGMDDAISKPFRIPELWPKICRILPDVLERLDHGT